MFGTRYHASRDITAFKAWAILAQYWDPAFTNGTALPYAPSDLLLIHSLGYILSRASEVGSPTNPIPHTNPWVLAGVHILATKKLF